MGVLLLCGCAAQRASYINQRDAPDLAFKGPLRPVSLSAPQIKQVQQGIAAGLSDAGPKTFGKSYRAAINADGQTIVCGYFNGKKFAGMFAKSQGGKTQFLPIGLSVDEQIRSNNIAVTMAFIFHNSEIEVLPKRGLQRPMHAS
jgi:hypothetical protein